MNEAVIMQAQTRQYLMKQAPYWFGTQEVSRDVALALKTIGYEEPTPIQIDCIGPLLAGNDVVGQALTGTGKTAAFGIPLVEQADLSQTFIQGLILVPTRELAMQVRDELIRLGQFRRLEWSLATEDSPSPSRFQRSSVSLI